MSYYSHFSRFFKAFATVISLDKGSTRTDVRGGTCLPDRQVCSPQPFNATRGSSYLSFFIFCNHVIEKTPRRSGRPFLLSHLSERCYYFISSNSFLFIFTKLNILDSTQGETSLLPWLGTGNIILPLEKRTCDYFCLTTSNHSFFNLVFISINLYGIL